MSGKKVSFVSGPRIAIKFGGRTVAYAIGLNLNFSVNVAPVMTLGRYDSSALEPTAFSLVRGSMTIVKLKAINSDGNLLPNLQAGGDLSRHLNPELVLASETFDLSVQLANMSGAGVVTGVEHIRVQDCRLSSMSGGITVGQMLNETVGFEGLVMFDRSQLEDAADAINTDIDKPFAL